MGWRQLVTDREAQILELLTYGLTYREIADELKISPRTVSSHLQTMGNKLKIRGKKQFRKYAEEHGY